MSLGGPPCGSRRWDRPGGAKRAGHPGWRQGPTGGLRGLRAMFLTPCARRRPATARGNLPLVSGPLSDSEQLTHLLRPAGAGLHTVSTGKAEQLALQRALYGVDDAAQVPAAWRRSLDDAGAGARGGAGHPLGLRGGAGARGAPSARGPASGRCCGAARPGAAGAAGRGGGRRGRRRGTAPAPRRHAERGAEAVLPAGALSDIVAGGGRRAARLAAVDRRARAGLPVRRSTPAPELLVLGGDHSVAWPVVAALARRRAPALGIVQPDAHTDLLPERLGVRYCFATWAYHANDLHRPRRAPGPGRRARLAAGTGSTGRARWACIRSGPKRWSREGRRRCWTRSCSTFAPEG